MITFFDRQQLISDIKDRQKKLREVHNKVLAALYDKLHQRRGDRYGFLFLKKRESDESFNEFVKRFMFGCASPTQQQINKLNGWLALLELKPDSETVGLTSEEIMEIFFDNYPKHFGQQHLS